MENASRAAWCLIHTWDDVNLLRDVVARYPGASFLLGHSGGGDTGRLQDEELLPGLAANMRRILSLRV